MSATCSSRTMMAAAAVATVILWATPAQGQPWFYWEDDDGLTVSLHYTFDDGSDPPTADTDVTPDWCEGATFSAEGDNPPHPRDMGGEHGGAWGLDWGRDQYGTLTVRVDNVLILSNIKYVWVRYEAHTAGDAWVATTNKTSDGSRRSRFRADEEEDLGDGWRRRSYQYVITPQPEWEEVTFMFHTGPGFGSCAIDNLYIGTHCYYVGYSNTSEAHDMSDDKVWPPIPVWNFAPPWYEGTEWDRWGSSPPQTMSAVTDHVDVLGLPGGLDENGTVTVRLDDLDQPDKTQPVCYQFDCYRAEGGSVSWYEELPSGSYVVDRQETVTAIGDGWERVKIRFVAEPRSDWIRFRWNLSTTYGRSGPVAIDNLIMSYGKIPNFEVTEPEGPKTPVGPVPSKPVEPAPVP